MSKRYRYDYERFVREEERVAKIKRGAAAVLGALAIGAAGLAGWSHLKGSETVECKGSQTVIVREGDTLETLARAKLDPEGELHKGAFMTAVIDHAGEANLTPGQPVSLPEICR